MTRVYLIVALLAAILRSSNAASCHDDCVCNTSDSMDCSSKKFTRLPEGYWPNVKELNLNDNDITTIHSHSFTGYPNVETLFLDKNALSVLDFELFSTMPKLISLTLRENKIGSIVTPSPDLVFNDFAWLALDRNNIEHLDPDMFTTLAPKLYSLDLEENPIEIPESGPLLNHPQLIWIEMMDCDGKNVDVETFAGLTNLAGLRLRHMGIVDINGLFANYNNLSLVFLEENEITEVLPGTFKTGRLVERLSLSKNPLQTLDLDTISAVMYGSAASYLDISDTPLACNCQYEAIYRWGQGRGVDVRANCDGVNKCSFTKSSFKNALRY